VVFRSETLKELLRASGFRESRPCIGDLLSADRRELHGSSRD